MVKGGAIKILEGSEYVIRTEYSSVRWACLSVIAMNRVSKLLLALLVASLLLFFLSPAIRAQEGRIYLDFADQTVSANIEDAPLRDVLTRIKKKKGIWFKACLKGESSLDEKVSLRFRNLPIQSGLERILSGMNHCLFFEKRRVMGVMLFGKPGKRTYKGRRRSVRRRR